MSTEAYCGTSLAVRVIPCLDVDDGRVVKGVNFENLRDAGDPVELAARAVRFAGARMLQAAFDILDKAEQMTGHAVRLMQGSLNVLTRPDWATTAEPAFLIVLSVIVIILVARLGPLWSALVGIAAIAVAALLPVIRSVRSGEPVGAWWRPAVAVVTAPLGLAGYWAYSAWATRHLGGFAWVEKNAHNSFDWGKGIILAAKQAIIAGPTAGVALTLLVIAAAVILTACSLAERIPVYLHAYTLVVVLLALTPGPYYLGSKPRFLLPAMLLGLPLARLLAKAPIWVLIPLIAVLAAASTWFGIYLMTTGWAP